MLDKFKAYLRGSGLVRHAARQFMRLLSWPWRPESSGPSYVPLMDHDRRALRSAHCRPKQSNQLMRDMTADVKTQILQIVLFCSTIELRPQTDAGVGNSIRGFGPSPIFTRQKDLHEQYYGKENILRCLYQLLIAGE
jgi:hypothetical protein